MIEDLSPEANYPELESEVDASAASSDDQPVRVVPSDWNVATLRDKYLKGKINLQPAYQRGYVWDQFPELKSKLIESLLLEIPIPPIYFAKLDGGRLEVIDGQQRLATLIRYMNGDFPLARLQRKSNLNGKRFADLDDEDQDKIHDSQIRSIVIDTGSNADLRYEVFERLNRGSVALKEQEIRNCVYRGPFNDLLAELEMSTEWRRVRGSDQPEPRFVEREMILRFFAFTNRLDHYRGNLRPFLNDYMGNHAPKSDPELKRQADMFKLAMRNVYQVFGQYSGRLYSNGPEDNQTIEGRWESKFSISALDIQASALISQSPANIDVAAEQIREAYVLYLLTNPQVRLAISRRPAGKEATFVAGECSGAKFRRSQAIFRLNVDSSNLNFARRSGTLATSAKYAITKFTRSKIAQSIISSLGLAVVKPFPKTDNSHIDPVTHVSVRINKSRVLKDTGHPLRQGLL